VASPEVALIARARGLGTHLLSRETLEALAEAPDLPALARGLSRLGAALEPVDETAEIGAIEQVPPRYSAFRWNGLRNPGGLRPPAAPRPRPRSRW